MVPVNLIQLEDNDLQAQEDYNSLFYDLNSDLEEDSFDRSDFCEPFSVLTCPSNMPTQA